MASQEVDTIELDKSTTTTVAETVAALDEAWKKKEVTVVVEEYEPEVRKPILDQSAKHEDDSRSNGQSDERKNAKLESPVPAPPSSSSSISKSLRKHKSFRRFLKRVDLSDGNISKPTDSVILRDGELGEDGAGSGAELLAAPGRQRNQITVVKPTGDEDGPDWCPEIPFENVSVSVCGFCIHRHTPFFLRSLIYVTRPRMIPLRLWWWRTNRLQPPLDVICQPSNRPTVKLIRLPHPLYQQLLHWHPHQQRQHRRVPQISGQFNNVAHATPR